MTDRRRRSVIEQGREAVDAGIDLIQVRERDLEAAPLAALVSALVAISRGTATRIVVNDRLDVALACGADGVHLRADSMPAARARTIAPAGFLIGRSVHQVDEAVGAASQVDYLIAGTVFPTSSKPENHPLLGMEGLRAVCRAVSVPVLAIGGVSMDHISRVAEAGAAGVAAIGLFAGDFPIVEMAARARQLWRGHSVRSRQVP